MPAHGHPSPANPRGRHGNKTRQLSVHEYTSGSEQKGGSPAAMPNVQINDNALPVKMALLSPNTFSRDARFCKLAKMLSCLFALNNYVSSASKICSLA